MISMKKAVVCCVLALAMSTLLVAQNGPGDRPEPTRDELVAHLNLSAQQLADLDANKDDFLDAVAPLQQQLRDLKRQLRQASRDGADTTSLQGQIEAVKASVDGQRATFTKIAQGFGQGAEQQTRLGELVGAESLMTEVRQAMGLLLVTASGEGPGGPGNGPRRGRKGPGGPGGPR